VSASQFVLEHHSPENLPHWYNACDIFVMPTRDINGDTESFGRVYLAAAVYVNTANIGRAGGGSRNYLWCHSL